MRSQEVEALKLDLVKAVRMLERADILDMNGHISARFPEDNHFYINARAASRASLTTQDITCCDINGYPLEGETEPPSEFHIHAAIYRRRPDVNAVIHSHPHWQTVLGIAGIAMQPVFSIGAFTVDFPVFEKSSLVNTPEMAEELAEVLGDHTVAQIRHHGNVLVGSGVREVFAASIYVEENAKKQYYAKLLNPNHHIMSGENLQRTKETNWAPSIIQKVWHYHEEKARMAGILDEL
ncbi:MAG: class II aldolase/adducin family protein [Alicyclobacillus herbarius]|uniref:class II aldolase/adducin family protein n=1 Tax=Alicyclobacillus herbarius TaxID=122960 RepID=UPI0023563091|nr:class II aldolase/adducin family protein [Alicyclobacillus herbarius]MCL6633802.1 class II aldolase/adducin family protein [Alicyclobacillus herbarius]